MKKILILCALIASIMTAHAQTAIDNFTVGPYIVDYHGQGDIRYRLRDNINLYEYFELKRDTTIVNAVIEGPSVKQAVQISGYVGANRLASKEIGISGLWKQGIGTNTYFNAGLSLALGYSNFTYIQKRNMLEVGIPLQIEVGRLNRQKAGLYGIFGIAPTYYSTMSVKTCCHNGKGYTDGGDDLKKSGFLVAPSLEFGGNIPVGTTIMRIGVYGTYKINCTTGELDVYKETAGRCFLGAKIGFAL